MLRTTMRKLSIFSGFNQQIVNILKELPTLTEGVISSSPTTTTAEDSEVTAAGLENGKKKRKNQPGEFFSIFLAMFYEIIAF
ncbi:Protein CBG26146 [Caenorhabditis briggsae]|uniref:Protein CBG26146 n=1 Tax=Caenorhabditis briggsae TaxID=6238 RepID=B6II50_CAEBR|nr:Protein CBG26146 [Caenorhabditis briggsae]CAR99580.1 Protein CBG26146 [Caenorhabditis briggsae]